MDRLKEIANRKKEIRELLQDETQEVNIDEIKAEIDRLDSEIEDIKAKLAESNPEAAEEPMEEEKDGEPEAEETAEEKPEEEPKEEEATEEENADKEADERRMIASAITKRSIEANIVKEEIKMNERKYDLESKEYRSAWAKTLMGVALNEEEKRAVGDAVGTTATTFVQADESHQGINNLGLLIPTSVRKEFLEILSEESPIFRDVRKLQVNGNVDIPYLDSADDANWYAELTDTANEGQEYKSIKLTGHELAKDVVITWKAEAMTVDGFINFIIDELKDKMGKALINAIIYGNGSGKPTGITNGLTPVTTGDSPVDCIVNTYKELDAKFRAGAKAYISTNVNIDIVGYKDENGNYPFLQGLDRTKLVAIEVDPYLTNNDIVVGNCKNYILNENEPLRIDKEITVKGRKVTYGGYAIYDGAPRTGAFAYGQYGSASV